jgi:hypothetical protein
MHVTDNGVSQSQQQSAVLGTKRRYKETNNLAELSNKQQHTSRTKIPPCTSRARSCPRMPSAEPPVRAAARPGSSQNPCVQCGGPLQR